MNCQQGPQRVTFSESASKCAKLLPLYADDVEKLGFADSDLVPLIRASAVHLTELKSEIEELRQDAEDLADALYIQSDGLSETWATYRAKYGDKKGGEG